MRTCSRYRTDIASESSVTDAYGRIDSELPRGGLVNLAGIAYPVRLHECSLAEFERVMAVNVTGSFLMLKAAAARMIPQGVGRIVNTSSITAFDGGGTFIAAAFMFIQGPINFDILRLFQRPVGASERQVISQLSRCRRKIGGEADELGLDARDSRHGSVRLESERRAGVVGADRSRRAGDRMPRDDVVRVVVGQQHAWDLAVHQPGPQHRRIADSLARSTSVRKSLAPCRSASAARHASLAGS
jgi:hypothetical protein